MSTEKNKAKVRQYFNEVCNKGRTELLPGIFDTNVSFNGVPGSPKDVENFLTDIKNSYTNLSVEVNKQVAEGDWVSTMRTWEGIQKDDNNGQASQGKKVSWKEISVVRFERGKIVEDWFINGKLNEKKEMDPKQQDFLVKDYELKTRYLSDHFQRMWTRFNFFVTIESALVGSKLVFGDGKFTIEVAWVGLIVSFVWFIIGSQDRHLVQVYRRQVEESGQKANRHILKDGPYTSVGSKPEKDNVFVNLAEWYVERISITRLAAWIPFVLMIAWAVTIIVLSNKG
jgi:predicted ester cyclase